MPQKATDKRLIAAARSPVWPDFSTADLANAKLAAFAKKWNITVRRLTINCAKSGHVAQNFALMSLVRHRSG
jgi:hypothetical protein